MIINELSAIAYNRFINTDYNTGYEDDGRIFNKALPSDTPVDPGTSRPMISRSPYVPLEESDAYTALHKLSRQGYRVSERFVEYLSACFPRGDENRKNWQDAIERTFLALWRKKNKVSYLDTFYDWRGRTYHMSGEWGSLQNSRLSRASLCSPETYKVDKNSKHYEYMIKCFKHEGWPTTYEEAQSYLGAPSFDGDGALDWMGVRAALALVEIEETGETDYLLEQDATCSGFQHMALLMGDMKLARMVNALLNNTDEELEELYMYVANKCNIAALLFNGCPRKARNFAKKIVMLTGYGSGSTGLACSYWTDAGGDGETDEEGRLVPDTDATIHIGTKKFKFVELKIFVKACQDVLIHEFPLIDTLKKICISFFGRCMNKDSSVFEWEAPDGFIARRIITQKEQDEETVGAAGAMPNLIHSLDAAIIRHTLLNWNGCIGVVHDAIFSRIVDALEIREVVRESYAAIHGNLNNFPINQKNNYTINDMGRCIGV